MGWCSTKRERSADQSESPFSPLRQDNVRFLSHGDLIAHGDYRLHSRFRRAINYLGNDGLVSVVDRSVGAGPCHLVVSSLSDCAGDRLVVQCDSVHLNGARFPLDPSRRFDSTMEFATRFDSEGFSTRLDSFKAELRTRAPSASLSFLLDGDMCCFSTDALRRAVARRFITGTQLIARGQCGQGISQIKGLGVGLTPSGDDFIAGLLIALNLRQQLFGEDFSDTIEEISAASRSSNPFSDALLRCASRGRIFERLRRVIAALLNVPTEMLAECTRDLLAVGATSGADIATGLVFGLESFPRAGTT